MASHEWVLLYFTHVEDDLNARREPLLTLWGQRDFIGYVQMERDLDGLSQYLIASSPPKDLSALAGQTIVALINGKWVRGRIVDTSLSTYGLIDVFCMDFGAVHSVPLACVRALDTSSIPSEINLVAQRQPFAQKFFLADVVSPQELWSDNVIRFAKAALENQMWRGFPLGTHGNGTSIRLEKNELLAKIMMCEMALPAPSYSARKPSHTLPVPTPSSMQTIAVVPSAKTLFLRNSKLNLGHNLLSSATRMHLQVGQQCIRPEEQIFVTRVHEVGKFFGQLERYPIEELNQIQAELLTVYGSFNEPPLLYADVKSHVGDSAIFKWSPHNQYYRIKIQEEFTNEVDVWFVDYGNILKVPKCEVLAPINVLNFFSKPNFGIFCELCSVSVSPLQWTKSLVDQSIHVKIVESKSNAYSVILTNNPINKKIADALKIPMSSNHPPTTSRLVANPLTPLWWETSPSTCRESGASVSEEGQTVVDSNDASRLKDESVDTERVQIEAQPTEPTLFPVTEEHSEIEAAAAPEFAHRDLPVPYDESCDEDDQNGTGAPPHLATVRQATQRVVDKLPISNAHFTRDQIISKNCSLCYFNNADDFWLQLDPFKVATLMQEIDEFSTKNDFAKLPPFQGAVGKACLSCYKESDAEPGLWHRGVVSAMSGDVGTVFYVDFGNSCPMKISEMKSLPIDLAEHPPLAYRCTLEGIESSETDLTEQFVDLFWLSTPVTVQFKRMKAGKFCVRLLRTTDGLDLNEKLGLHA